MRLQKLDKSNPSHSDIIQAALDSYMCDFEQHQTVEFEVLSQHPTGADVLAFADVPTAGQTVLAVVNNAEWEKNTFFLLAGNQYKPWKIT
jgi:hypothetical protein